MNKYLQAMLRAKQPSSRYLDQANDGTTGSAGGSAVDRGDTLSAGAPTVDAAAAAAEADAAAEAERIRAEQEAATAAAAATGEGGSAASEEASAGKSGVIPLERHKAVLDKARAERDEAVAKLAQYQGAKQVEKTNDDIGKIDEKVVAKEAEYNKALIDGDVEKAGALMREIRTLERQAGDLRIEMRTQAATAQAVESVRYGSVVERLEAAYPALNPDHESFDKEQVQDVMDLKATYERRGLTPSAALQKAVEKLMPAATAKQEAATTVTPRVTEADAAAATAAARKADATAKGIDAASKTPPSTAKVGADSDKHGGGELSAQKVMGMSQDQFSKITEADLARLRGDVM